MEGRWREEVMNICNWLYAAMQIMTRLAIWNAIGIAGRFVSRVQ